MFGHKKLTHNSNTPNAVQLLAGNCSNYGNEMKVEEKNTADNDTEENKNDSHDNTKDKDFKPNLFFM